MIEIRYLQAESGANKFGTCNCCGKSSGEDPLMISVKFSYYGHGTLICLCDDCKKKLMEVLNGEKLPPANNSEIPNSSDTISRAKAIEALKNDMASLDHIIKGMSANDVRLDAYVSQRNQINYDIYTINNLPPAQPEQLGTNLAEVGTDCISREQAIEICDHAIDLLKGQFGAGALVAIKESIEELPPAQPERIKGHWVNGRCDKCNEHAPFWAMASTYYASNFCPNCGAEMEVTT